MRAREFLLVGLGGAAGTALRLGTALLVPTGPAWWPTLLVNLVGSFALGALYARVPAGTGRSRDLRLALGTGLLGGFTTYSSLAVQALTHGTLGYAFAALSLVLGLLAAAAGLSWALPRGRGAR